MIESNNEKNIYLCKFYTADEKLCEYVKCFGEKSKNRDKLSQFVTPGRHTKIRDCPGKTGTVKMFVTTQLSWCRILLNLLLLRTMKIVTLREMFSRNHPAIVK